jgi:excisionase family DNA binding protein
MKMMENISFEQIPAAIGQLFLRLDAIELLITNTQSGKEADEDILMTIQQAGKYISLTVPTIYGLVSRAQIPCSKKGKRLYFSKQELTDWIKSGRKKTNAETQALAAQYLKTKKS